MTDPELGLTLVFNGCIYNYKELRDELSAYGYRFFSTSDSEVIIKAYHRWGSACVRRFLGMFAFAILEHSTGEVVLYSKTEALQSGRGSRITVGRDFFLDVAPCMDTPGFRQRIAAEAAAVRMVAAGGATEARASGRPRRRRRQGGSPSRSSRSPRAGRLRSGPARSTRACRTA